MALGKDAIAKVMLAFMEQGGISTERSLRKQGQCHYI